VDALNNTRMSSDIVLERLERLVAEAAAGLEETLNRD